MNSIPIAGDAQSALTHFALYGLTSIIQYELNKPALVGFTAEVEPQGVIETSVSNAEVAQAVWVVAKRWSQTDSWVQATLAYPDKKSKVDRSPFSPRIQVINTREMWEAHQAFRLSYIDQLEKTDDQLALRLIAGLGEASYWRFQGKERRPDHGASRWEMKTRNRGEEFIVHRFAPMCKELSTWNPSEILSGINGATVNDSLGKQKSSSRTSTGFTTPRATDVALAFCALVGMGCFPVLHQSTAMSVTPAAFPRNGLHTKNMVLPVPAKPLTLARMESILLSAELFESSLHNVEDQGHDEASALKTSAARKWLQVRGIGALAHFSVLKTGSDSAPERQVLTGRLEAL